MLHPKQLGPFRIVRVVGRGGMGAVYEAVHEETNETVAVKMLLNPPDDENSEQKNRFEAEIETLKRLRHPNIVRLHGFGQEEGILYYAMEYVDGPSLQSFLKKKRLFTWEEVVYIGIEICKALKHAHDRGVIHRDIKPANILLVENGQIKVSDYGIAHFFGNSRMTDCNMVIGTIEYMSPEQAQAGPLTPRSDIYSLGALLYALITGSPPYIAKSLPEILKKYKQGPPESIRFKRPEVPQVLDQLILELLNVRPEKRPLDARLIGRRFEAIRLAFSPNPDQNPFQTSASSLQEQYMREDDASSDEKGTEQSSSEQSNSTKNRYSPVESNGSAIESPSDFDSVVLPFSADDREKTGDDRYQPIPNDDDTDSRIRLDVATEETFHLNSQFFGPTRFDLSQSSEDATVSRRLAFADESGDSSGSIAENTDFILNDESFRSSEKFGDSTLESEVSDCSTQSSIAETVCSSDKTDSGVLTDFVQKQGVFAKTNDVSIDRNQRRDDRPTVVQNSNRSDGQTIKIDSAASDRFSQETLAVFPDQETSDSPTLARTTNNPNPNVRLAAETVSTTRQTLRSLSLSGGSSSDLHFRDENDIPTLSVASLRGDELLEPQEIQVNDETDERFDEAGELHSDDHSAIIPIVENDERSGATPQTPQALIHLPPFPDANEDDQERSNSTGKTTIFSTKAFVFDPSTAQPLPPHIFEKKSHFTRVDESELDRLELENPPLISLKTWIFSATMIVVGAVLWFLLQPPAADSLYRRVISKIDRGKLRNVELLTTLRSVEPDLNRFMEIYPNDSRTFEMQRYKDELALEELERKLNRFIERKSLDHKSFDALSSIESTYVITMREVQENPKSGIERLQEFVDFFSANKKNEPNQDETNRRRTLIQTLPGQCVLLAERKRDALIAERSLIQKRMESLLDEQLQIVEELSGTDVEQAKRLRENALLFFDDYDWAARKIEEVSKEQLSDDARPEIPQNDSPEPETSPDE